MEQQLTVPEVTRLPNMTPTARCHLTQVTRTITASKASQVSLASVKVSFHNSTIRKTLNKNGINGRLKQAPHVLRLQSTFWENILWAGETKV